MQIEINVADARKDEIIFLMYRTRAKWSLNAISALMQYVRFDGRANGIICDEICVEEVKFSYVFPYKIVNIDK